MIPSGYTITLQGLNGDVEDEITGFVAKLGAIIVAERVGINVTLRLDATRIQDSVSAINQAFEDAGVSGFKVTPDLKFLDSKRGSRDFTSPLTFTLDTGLNPIARGSNPNYLDDRDPFDF